MPMDTNVEKFSEQDALQDLKDYYNSIIEQLPGHIYWKDKNGIILGCNDAQAQAVGLKYAQEMVGLTVYDTLPAEQADQITQIDQQVMTTGNPVITEETSNVISGESRVYLSKKVPLFHKKTKEVIGLLGISIDITAQQEAERLQKEKEEAEKRSQYLRAAAGSIAHELRTPLASIGMAARAIHEIWHTLLAGYRLALQAHLPVEEINERKLSFLDEFAQSIIENTRFSNMFIDLVLGNLKEEKELNIDDYKIHDINTVVNRSLEHYPFSHEQRLLLNWHPQESFEFLGNDFLMKNVLNNLIKNSLYYIKAARKGEIYIWLGRNECHNLLYFKDTARGASSEVLSHLFQNFYSKRYGGTGLGLAFCKKIMHSFGGDITADSIEGEYIQFTLSFPIKESE